MSKAKWTKKQKDVLNCIRKEKPKILICYGAMRAGKTYVISIAFLSHIAKFEGQNKKFIVGGATYANIWRNILDDWEVLLGIQFKLHKDNSFDLFGNKVYIFGGETASSWKAVRGCTAAGALLNEATALHNTFIKECIARCSEKGSVIYMDTNPDNPTHFVKTDYVDKSGARFKNGKLNIQAYHFTLYDNDTLDQEYVESIENATPSGMFTDRNIFGKWVSPEGVVYKDFKQEAIITQLQLQNILKKQYELHKQNEYLKQFKIIWAGVDWGYSHYGSILVLAVDYENKFYVLEEHAKQFQEIDHWVDIAKGIVQRYGNINFYCDSARPEHVVRFQREKIKAFNANKKVLVGIETVSKLLKLNRLFIVNDKADKSRLLTEFNLYAWKDNSNEPLKLNDDCLDALRYAIYSYYILNPKIFGF